MTPPRGRLVGGASAMTVSALLAGLTGCSLAHTTNQNTLVVDFQNRQATAARLEVSKACGSLPGVSVVPPRKEDVSVYFDINKANAAEQSVLTTCVNNLVPNKSLGIRGYRFDDGTDS